MKTTVDALVSRTCNITLAADLSRARYVHDYRVVGRQRRTGISMTLTFHHQVPGMTAESIGELQASDYKGNAPAVERSNYKCGTQLLFRDLEVRGSGVETKLRIAYEVPSKLKLESTWRHDDIVYPAVLYHAFPTKRVDVRFKFPANVKVATVLLAPSRATASSLTEFTELDLLPGSFSLYVIQLRRTRSILAPFRTIMTKAALHEVVAAVMGAVYRLVTHQ